MRHSPWLAARMCLSISCVIEGGCPGGISLQVSLFLRPHQSRWLTGHILTPSQTLSPLRRTIKINMDLLVAGLQGIDHHGCIGYEILVDMKEKNI
jgi:hypothetical protein